MNRRSKTISKLSRYIFVFLICLVFLVGCNLQNTEKFPNISYQNNNNITPTESPDHQSINIASGTLHVAVPLSSECLRYLALMYVGETAGLFNDVQQGENGYTVTLETLESFDVGLNIDLQQVGSSGISENELITDSLSNSIPDIMLIKDTRMLDKYQIDPQNLTSSYSNHYISPALVYPAMFQNSIENKELNSIPYYAAARMLYANSAVLVDSDNKSLLADKNQLSLSEMQKLAKTATKTKTNVYGFMGLSDLLEVYPAIVDSSVNRDMWNGTRFDFLHNAFNNSLTSLKSFIKNGGVVDSLTEKQKKDKYGTSDPRSLGKIGFWIDDSTQLENWNSLGLTNIRRFMIQNDKDPVIPLSVYSLVVNSKSELLEDAARFAAYIALDSDALLFRSRYTVQNGLIPPIKDKRVWDHLVSTQLQGGEIYSIYEQMDHAKSITGKPEDEIRAIFSSLYNKYFNDVLYSRISFTTYRDTINKEANQGLTGE